MTLIEWTQCSLKMKAAHWRNIFLDELSSAYSRESWSVIKRIAFWTDAVRSNMLFYVTVLQESDRPRVGDGRVIREESFMAG